MKIEINVIPKKSGSKQAVLVSFEPYKSDTPEAEILKAVLALKEAGMDEKDVAAKAVVIAQQLILFYLPMTTKIAFDFQKQQSNTYYRRADLLGEAMGTLVRVVNEFPRAKHTNLKDAIASNVWLRLQEFARLDYTVRPSVYAQRRGANQRCCEAQPLEDIDFVNRDIREPAAKTAHCGASFVEFKTQLLQGLSEDELLIVQELESGTTEARAIQQSTHIPQRRVYRLLDSIRKKTHENLRNMEDLDIKVPRL